MTIADQGQTINWQNEALCFLLVLKAESLRARRDSNHDIHEDVHLVQSCFNDPMIILALKLVPIVKEIKLASDIL